MRTVFLAGAAAVAMFAAPAAIAQADPTGDVSTVPGSTNSVDDKRGDHTMTSEQQTMYDSWPEDQRADYDTWPSDYQVYYWGLEPEYQTGYWALTPDQRTRIYGMTDEQQTSAWTSIMAQLNGAPAPMSDTSATAATGAQAMPATSSASTAGSGNTRFVNNEMVQSAPAPRQGEYPICSADQTDNCINAYAAGKRGAGVNRPMEEWPGKPASEM